jgi:leucyl aminopeptidase (aminopeptidase T)
LNNTFNANLASAPTALTSPARTATGLPINHSATQVDFMIGGPDLTVTGVRSDGSRRVILEGEHRAL